MKKAENKKSPKVFLGTVEIAGLMLKLHKALDALNVENTYLCFWEYKFASDESEYYNHELDEYFRIVKMFRKYNARNKTFIVRVVQFIEMFVVLKIFIKALIKYDSFIYIYGHGIFQLTRYLRPFEELEFWLYRLLGKRVVVIFCGSDSRPLYCGIFEGDVHKMYTETKKIAKRVNMIEKYATVIDTPASSQFHNKPYIKYNSILPLIDYDEIIPHKKENNERIRILHAPSVKRWKGTEEIHNLMQRLERAGFPIEYIEVSGKAHSEVLAEICKADIIIDQLFSDVPMATFASEGMANGVPVVVCGFYADYLPAGTYTPTCYWSLDDLEKNLIELIQNKEEQKKLGREGAAYIKKHYMTEDVAKRFLMLLNGDYPQDWIFNPMDGQYPYGFGNTKQELAEKVAALVDCYSFDALCINKKKPIFAEYEKIYKSYCEKHPNREWNDKRFT